MMFSKVLICLALSTALAAAETAATTDEKTTEAVVKAVIKAESKSEPNAESKPDAAKNDRAATAVAQATTEVLEKETAAKGVVPSEVLAKAATGAKTTFKEMKEAGVSSEAAAAAAAEVESATVDGASGLALTTEQKKNAEKAAVAAGKAVEDHPDNQASALAEALSTVKKEEKSGKKVLDTPAQGVVANAKHAVAKATNAVSNLPQLAEGAVSDGMQTVEHHGIGGLFLIAIPLIAGGVAYKFFGDKFQLKGIDLNKGWNRSLFPAENEIKEERVRDLETQYAKFDECNEMKTFA